MTNDYLCPNCGGIASEAERICPHCGVLKRTLPRAEEAAPGNGQVLPSRELDLNNPYQAPGAPLPAAAGPEEALFLAELSTRFLGNLADIVFLILVVQGSIVILSQLAPSGVLLGEFLGFGIVLAVQLNFLRHGKTVGKRLLGTRVVDFDGRVPPFWRLLLRGSFYWVLSVIPIVNLVNILAIFFGNQKRCLHDVVGGTVVVRG